MNDLASFSEVIAAGVATYLLHSTCLFGACWLLLTLIRSRSHFLAERMWKLAAVLGIVTALAQTLAGSNRLPLSMLPPAERKALLDRPAKPLSRIQATLPLDEEALANTELVRSDSAFGRADGGVDLQQAIEQQATADDGEFAAGDASARAGPSLRIDLAEAKPAEQAVSRGAWHAEQDLLERESEAVGRAWLNVFVHACSLTFVVGVVGGSVLLGVQMLRLRTRFGRARVLRTGPARLALDRFLKRYKIQGRIRLLASGNHCEPFAYGLFQWTIVLPEGAEDRLERNELQALLAHEVAHLVRGDVRWLWMGRVLCTCCAFQPLNFLARRRWQQAAEYLCDDWAVERGVRSLSLARCLTRVAEWRVGVDSPEVGLAAGGSKATLVGRVQRLVKERPPNDAWKTPLRRRTLAMSAAVAAIALVGFAPRVALPLTLVDERASSASRDAIESLVDEPDAGDWLALEEELLQLEADLRRVDKLRSSTESSELASHFQNLHRRAARLRTRREHITSLVERESQR